jgi:hypothetical protein
VDIIRAENIEGLDKFCGRVSHFFVCVAEVNLAGFEKGAKVCIIEQNLISKSFCGCFH